MKVLRTNSKVNSETQFLLTFAFFYSCHCGQNRLIHVRHYINDKVLPPDCIILWALRRYFPVVTSCAVFYSQIYLDRQDKTLRGRNRWTTWHENGRSYKSGCYKNDVTDRKIPIEPHVALKLYRNLI